MRLMIVDDEKLLRSGFKHMAEWSKKGIEIVAEAMNGEDALAKIPISKPDVVLTDINMPVMDGIELTKKIKKTYSDIIVIVLSGYDDYEYIRKSMKYGASDYLLKATMDADELYHLLKEIKINNKRVTNQNDIIQVDLSNSLFFDKNILMQYIELQQMDSLKKHIIDILKNCNLDSPKALQEMLLDFFFFVQFHLYQLGLIDSKSKQSKYINSSSVSLVKDKQSAQDWINIVLDEISQQCSKNSPKKKVIVQKVFEFVESNYSSPELTLSYIADNLFINKNYLCDIFKAEVGTTINHYISDIRIAKAKELIRTSKLSLHTIANKVGFSDYNYFSRVFSKKMGIPPREYQKIYMKSP